MMIWQMQKKSSLEYFKTNRPMITKVHQVEKDEIFG